jgi:hypothetical protein
MGKGSKDDRNTLRRMAGLLAVPKSEIDAAERKRVKRSGPKKKR